MNISIGRVYEVNKFVGISTDLDILLIVRGVEGLSVWFLGYKYEITLEYTDISKSSANFVINGKEFRNRSIIFGSSNICYSVIDLYAYVMLEIDSFRILLTRGKMYVLGFNKDCRCILDVLPELRSKIPYCAYNLSRYYIESVINGIECDSKRFKRSIVLRL